MDAARKSAFVVESECAMKTKLMANWKVQLAFAAAFVTLFVVGALSYRTIVVSGESDRWVEHTQEVLENLKSLQFEMGSVSASVRGFALTGKDDYLEPFRASKLNIQQHLAAIRTLTADRPEQQRRLPGLERLATERMARGDMVVALRRDQGLEAAAHDIQNGPSQRISDEFQSLIREMQDEEQRLLVLRKTDAAQRFDQTKTALIFGTILGLLITAAAGWSVWRDSSRRGHAEAALQDSQERYRMLLDEVRDHAIIMMDPQGKIVTWNAGAEQIQGYSADEIIGRDFSCFYPPEDIARGRPQEILRLTAASGRLEEHGMRVRKDGSRFLASIVFTALHDAAGNLRGFSGICRDLSESKEAGAKYRGLLEAAPDAMVVVNQGGEIVLLNLQAEKEFGYHRDELVGQKVTNIIPEGFAERLVADDLRSTEGALAQEIGGGIELTGRRKDGSEFPIEIMLSPLESAEGTLVTAAIRDISVRKAADKVLAQMEGRYRGLLEAAPDAMVVVNQDGGIVLLNLQAEKEFGYHRDELVGQKVTNIIPEGFAERLVADDLRFTEGETAQEIGGGIELTGRRKDGSEFPIEIMLSPLESAEGTLVTAAIRDISVRKAAEKVLAQMEGRYRGLLEAAPDAMVVVHQDGGIVLLNLQAEKEFGYHRDELLGQKVTNIIPEGFAERLVADDLRFKEGALAQEIGGGIELTGRRKDGSEFPIEIMLSPLESAEGTLVTAAIRDISVRKAAEKVLAQMEGRYRGLLEAAPDAMVVVHQDGGIVLLNLQAEKEFGYRRDELLGQKVTNLIPEGFAERLVADDLRFKEGALAQEIGGGIELTGRRKDGSEFPIEIMLSPLESAEGTLVTAAIRDISVRKAADKVLAQMEGRYRGLLEAAPDAMVVVNQDGGIVLLNLQAEKEFGYHRDELLGQKVTNLIPEGFAERLVADDLRFTEGETAQEIGGGIELTGRRKDGSEFPIEIMLSPLESAEGTLVTAAIRDISVRKAAEQVLAQMEGRYRGLLEAAPDAMVVVNQDGGIVLLNLQAEKEFGYHRDELLGQKVTNIIPEGFAERLIADDLRSEEDALAQQIDSGIELTGRRKDGSEFPIEIMLSPLESAEGTLVTAAIRDISVRKAAEKVLAQMEGRYRGLLEAAPDAMVVVHQDGGIVLLNLQAEKEFGYRRDELLGQKVTNIIPEGFAERLIADGLRSAEDALAQQIGTGIELIARRKDGSEFPIELMLSPLESAEGTLVTAAIRDITTRKKAEAQLLQKVEELNRSNVELGQFAYIASHDLQEPLRMVASYTQLLSRRYKGKLDSDADEFIAFAVDGATRMQRLIQDLLAYSRVGTKGKELRDTSSEETLGQAIINLRGAIQESGALVTHDPLPPVMADERQLIQLFQNLVGNAIKYQNPGVPKVHISAAKNGGKQWIFSVQDNGLGIDSQYFDRIFGMFQRLHKREEFAGTGIGLAICKKIVERHGGNISVESQPGEGSTFRFDLTASERPS
jgi:PAS domain S-box-containing protein